MAQPNMKTYIYIYIWLVLHPEVLLRRCEASTQAGSLPARGKLGPHVHPQGARQIDQCRQEGACERRPRSAGRQGVADA